MFPSATPTPQLSKAERQLCKLYKNLNDNNREALMSFAEFLNSKTLDLNPKETEAVLQVPLPFEVDENESVVKGIKRLKSSYFMIENEDLLHEVSAFMTQHVMQGVSAVEIMPEIEKVFKKFYEQYKQDFIKNNSPA